MVDRPEILVTWDEIQHDPLSLPPNDFEGMSQAEAVEAIKVWFLENFEDPVHSTPYENAEGGYQYIWGGPYNARDIIENVFADTASEELIQAAVEEMENESWEWVPNERRRQAPEEDEPEEATDVATLHSQMLERIAAIEQALIALPNGEAGIGHNNPPEPIDDVPLDEHERLELKQSFETLKSQPVDPVDQGKAASGSVSFLQTIAKKAQAWLARQGDAFISEAVKEAGKEFGKWGTRAAWVWVLDQLIGLASIAEKWFSAIHWPF